MEALEFSVTFWYTMEICYLWILFWTNVITQFLKTIFLSFVAFNFYQFKIVCRLPKKTKTYHMMDSYIKNNIQNNIDVPLKYHMHLYLKVKFCTGRQLAKMVPLLNGQLLLQILKQEIFFCKSPNFDFRLCL